MMKKFYILFIVLWSVLGWSQSVSLYNPGSGAAYPSELYFCAGENFSLKVDAVASSTGDYEVTKEFPSGYPLAAGGTPIVFSAIGANKFSQAIPIGFTFSFYGKDYINVVAGSNGRLVLTNSPELGNLKDISTYIDRPFSGLGGFGYTKLPSTDYNKVYRTDPALELDLAQIFFGYTNLVPASANPAVTYFYKTVSVGGQPALQISYQNQIQTNGTGGISSARYNSTILLIQGGKIVINVTNKTEDTYNAILGIQNEDASKFKVPPHSTVTSDYNNGQWKDEGLAMVFTPNQNLTPQFKWFQNATPLAETTNTLTDFSPNDGDVVKVEVTYLEDPARLETAQVIFKKMVKPVITPSSSGGCVTGVNLTVPNDPALRYEWFRVGNPAVLGTGNSYYASATGNYVVRAIRIISPLCFEESLPVNVSLSSTIPAFNESNTPLYYCDSAGATNKTINLFNYYPPDPTKYTLVFSEGGIPIADPTNFVIAANTNKTIHIDVNDPVSGCLIDLDLNIRYDSLPTAISDLPKRFCFGGTSVDVSQYLPELGGTGFGIFSYQYSTDGTTYSSNSIINPQLSSKVWVKITPQNPPAGSCTTVSTIIFTEDAKIVANTPTTQLPSQCASATQTFDLASLIPEINADSNVTVTFHNTLQHAENGTNAVANNFRSGLGSTTLYIRVVNNVTGCVSPDHPQITLLVYAKPTLLATAVNKKNCVGNTVFDLTQNPDDLVTATAPITVTLEYYSQNGTLLSGSQISNYDEAVYGANPYIKVVYNPTCSDNVTFNLSYNPKPVALISQILICAETSYSLQDFKNKVVTNPSQYTFTDEFGAPLPANFDLSVLPRPVRFLLTDNITGCVSDVQTVSFEKGGKSALLVSETGYVLCDTDFDGVTSFNLDSKKTDFTADSSAQFEYFKDAALTQSVSANYSNETPFAQTIYVKITLTGFCPSTAKIHLVANIPAKSSTLVDKYFICYGETVTIDAGPENDNVQWSNGQTGQTATFTSAGSYSVTLKNGPDGCPYTHNFIVSDENQPKIQVINQTDNSIEVIASGGVQPYRYYFNGVPQGSQILLNPKEPYYEIQVESATGCFGPPKTVYFIKIHNAFSPNGDGINDIWKIENLDQMESVNLQITDRFGNRIFETQNKNKIEWDGKSGGRAVPSATYWYTVQWFDAVTQKNEQRQGWILLKNRN